MPDSTLSLIARTGLDQGRAETLLKRGLEGADDGELFLEYRQAEALVFDNGRLKQATYDTAQGFGLRAVKGEAVGYAHASDVSEEAIARAVEAVRAVQGGYSGSYSQAPARTNVKLYGDENPLGAPSFETKVKLLEEIDAYTRAKDPRVRQVSVSFGASWQVVEILRADGETYRDVRPLVRVNVSVVAGEGDRQEFGQPWLWRARGLPALHRGRAMEGRGRRRGASGAGEPRSGAGAGRRNGCRARRRLAGRDAARGGRTRARRRLQSQEDVGLRRPDGPAGRRQGRDRG